MILLNFQVWPTEYGPEYMHGNDIQATTSQHAAQSWGAHEDDLSNDYLISNGQPASVYVLLDAPAAKPEIWQVSGHLQRVYTAKKQQ